MHEMQKWLQSWIMQYVDGDPANSSELVKAKKPLAAAEVIVEEALDLSGSLEEVIDNIATSIPDPEQSASFRAEARRQTRLISL